MSGFADFYLSHEYGFASTQLILAMLGMGATLERSDFVEVESEADKGTRFTVWLPESPADRLEQTSEGASP